jgi:two-component system response regulator FixJ
MPDLSGIDLLRRLRELKVAVPVIVITAYGDIPLAVEAMRLGAADLHLLPMCYSKIRHANSLMNVNPERGIAG